MVQKQRTKCLLNCLSKLKGQNSQLDYGCSEFRKYLHSINIWILTENAVAEFKNTLLVEKMQSTVVKIFYYLTILLYINRQKYSLATLVCCD